MYIIRCLFVALLVALASANQPEMKRELNGYCTCSNAADKGVQGVAWFSLVGCVDGYRYCGNALNTIWFTKCCRRI